MDYSAENQTHEKQRILLSRTSRKPNKAEHIINWILSSSLADNKHLIK